MRILVLSDTHGDISRAYSIIKSTKGLIDGVIHCGDIVEDADTLMSKFPDLPFYNVRGNCDYGSAVPSEKIFEFGGKRFFITHGDMYGVSWDINNIYYKAMEVGADICVFGHTHIPIMENCNGIVIMNPGSLTRPRGGSKSCYGIIKIEDGTVTQSIVEYR